MLYQYCRIQHQNSLNNCIQPADSGSHHTLINLISFIVLELWLENFTKSQTLMDRSIFDKTWTTQGTKYHARIVILRCCCRARRQHSTLTASLAESQADAPSSLPRLLPQVQHPKQHEKNQVNGNVWRSPSIFTNWIVNL